MNNCGFVAWVDEEWPVTMKAALGRLWGMYEESSSGRIDDRVENARLLQELASEKKKFEKKYSSLMSDVNKFIDDMVKRAQQENYRVSLCCLYTCISEEDDTEQLGGFFVDVDE